MIDDCTDGIIRGLIAGTIISVAVCFLTIEYMERKAIAAKVAEYYINTNGNKDFRYLTENNNQTK